MDELPEILCKKKWNRRTNQEKYWQKTKWGGRHCREHDEDLQISSFIIEHEAITESDGTNTRHVPVTLPQVEETHLSRKYVTT